MMSEIYKTSGWEWQTIDQGVEMLTGSTFVTRSNWTLIRHRWSNAPYVSQYGTTEERLIGYNAGIYNEIEGPTIQGVKFDTTTEWVDANTLWVANGAERSNQPVYVQYLTENKPSSALVNALARATVWTVGEYTRDDVEAEEWTTSTNARQLTSADLGDEPFDQFAGSWTGFTPSTPVVGDFIAPLLCESDQRAYEAQGVNWYKQTQRWIYKDSWS